MICLLPLSQRINLKSDPNKKPIFLYFMISELNMAKIIAYFLPVFDSCFNPDKNQNVKC